MRKPLQNSEINIGDKLYFRWSYFWDKLEIECPFILIEITGKEKVWEREKDTHYVYKAKAVDTGIEIKETIINYGLSKSIPNWDKPTTPRYRENQKVRYLGNLYKIAGMSWQDFGYWFYHLRTLDGNGGTGAEEDDLNSEELTLF